MPPQDLFFLRALVVTEPDFPRALRRDAGRVAGRGAGLDSRSVFAATDPRVAPIVRAKLIRRPSFFLAGLLRRLFSICSPKIPGDMDFISIRRFSSAAFGSAGDALVTTIFSGRDDLRTIREMNTHFTRD